MIGELKLRDGEYLPDVGTVYPTDDPLTRLVPTKQVKTETFDENYPFYDGSLSYKIQRAIVYLIAFGPVFLLNRLQYGLRIEGHDNIRAHRKDFKNGLISVSNHCYKFDGVAIAYALRHGLYIPMLSDLMTSSNWWLLRYLGGIPLANPAPSAQRKFNEAFDTIHEKKGWIHVFAEARSWHFYKPLRPFQKGAFTMAYKYDVPIVPISISYRERTGIYRLFGPKERPLITVRVGEPIFPDRTQPRRTEVDRLLRQTHKAVCDLGGIIENPWPAAYSDLTGKSE